MDRRTSSVFLVSTILLLLGILQNVSAQTQSSVVQLAATPVSFTRQGIVLVSINGGAYGAICDTDWDLNDATVVCRQLGYDVSSSTASNPAASYQVRSAYGSLNFTGVMTQVACIGNEVDISHCPYVSPVTITAQQCTNANFAGVTCFGQYLGSASSSSSLITCQNTANVRLLNGTGSNFTNGVLQVSQNGNSWGTVCSQGFTQTNARVVCSSLCSGISTNAMSYPGSYYGQAAPSQIVLSNVTCAGTESSILQCPSNGFNTSTTCSDAVGINCAGAYSYLPSGTLTCGGTSMQMVFNQTTNYVITAVTPKNSSLCVNVSSYSFTSASSSYIFTLSYSDCNTSASVLYNSNGLPAFYQYSNLIMIYVQDSLGVITRASQFQMNISCQIQRTSTANNTYQTGTVILPSQQNNASIQITAVINFFADPGYSVVLQPPVLVQLNTPVYAQVTVSQSAAALNYRVLVPTCVASPFENISAPLYYLIQNNCVNDSTTVQFTSSSSQSLLFVFYSFQFTGNYSAVYLQCTTLLCGQNDYTGLCSGVCGTSSGAVGRRKRDVSSQQLQTHLINGPLYNSPLAASYSGAPASVVPSGNYGGIITRSVVSNLESSGNSSSGTSATSSGILATTSFSSASSTFSVFVNLTSTATSSAATSTSNPSTSTSTSNPTSTSTATPSSTTASLSTSTNSIRFSSSAQFNSSRSVFNFTYDSISFGASTQNSAAALTILLLFLIAMLV